MLHIASREVDISRDIAGREQLPVVSWQRVDAELRSLASRRASLDADEAHWLREAEACQVWRSLGMVSAIDYMERVLGYAPRTAQDRLRVARALGSLPHLTQALADGVLSFSAVRELTRVATSATEVAWRDAAAGRNLRQIEDLVAEHRAGDRPDDPPDPDARPRVVRFELQPETFALLRQAHQHLDEEHGRRLSDDELVGALCSAIFDDTPATEATGRAKFQIATVICRRCRQGWQEGAGARVAISAAAVDRAECDAQYVGSLDGEAPERAHQDVSPSVSRLVWRRDGGRCRVPGCRSTRGLEIHHLVHRADGGGHEADNLVLLCGAHHSAHHRGTLVITGPADQLTVCVGLEACAGGSDAHVGAVGASAGGSDAHVGAVGASACGAEVHVDAVGASAGGAEVHVGAVDASPCGAEVHVGVADERRGGAEVHAVAADGVEVYVVTSDGRAGAGEVCVGSSEIRSSRIDAHVGAQAATALQLEIAIWRVEAKQALVQLGWKPAIAAAAVASALSSSPAACTTLEGLIVEALRRCPRPARS